MPAEPQVSEFADLWVEVIEPSFKMGLMLLVILGVIKLIYFLKKPDVWLDVANIVFAYLVTFISTTGNIVWKVIHYVFSTIMTILRVCFATVRDFFISRI